MSGQEQVFIVEDDTDMRESCSYALKINGYTTLEASSPAMVEKILQQEFVSLIITDLRMPDGGGLQVVETAKKIAPEIPIIIITAYPTVESAVEAFKNGVVEYLLKPFTSDQLIKVVRQVLEAARAKDHAEIFRCNSYLSTFPEIIGTSKSLRLLLADIRRAAHLEGHVLITGETGTGKKLAAKAIHKLSKRADEKFIIADCTALPSALFEPELFGYEGGDDTNALITKTGLMEQADMGILLMDEVSDVPFSTQARLLYSLENNVCHRIGGMHANPINVRVIASTRKNLREEIKRGHFKDNLYYQLSTIEIRVPPLRERNEDIPQLATSFLDTLCLENNRKVVGFTDTAMEMLIEYSWPGNITEFQKVIKKVFESTNGNLITETNISETGILGKFLNTKRKSQSRSNVIAGIERNYLTETLCKYDWNVTHTAAALCIHRTTLQRLMKKYSIFPPPKS
ncbi:MAG: sigma-54-dependent Fis family transcriptional regulator [Planctomycetes bacterium]|nr:sigma-54-dependent Fis family transcriptional regulator [Planctomycetota bacterium]